MNEIKTVVVTGATGFLGKHLIAELLNRNFEITVLTRDKNKAEIIFKNKPIKIITVSLMDIESLKIPDQATIFHCAAITGSVHANKGEYNLANIIGTENLLKAAIQKQARSFTLISSISAVGAVGSHLQPITEETLPCPKTYYGKSKLASEKIVWNLAPEQMPVTIVRPPLIYGSDQKRSSGAGVLFNLCSRKIVPIIGDLNASLPLIYVKNLVEGLIHLTINNKGREIYNIADNNGYTIKHLMDIFKNPSLKQNFIRIPYPIASVAGFIGDGGTWLLKKDLGLCSEMIRGIGKSGFMMNIDKAHRAGYKPNTVLSMDILKGDS